VRELVEGAFDAEVGRECELEDGGVGRQVVETRSASRDRLRPPEASFAFAGTTEPPAARAQYLADAA